MALVMGATWLVGKGFEAIHDWIHADEILIEKG
jgi:hypothetical protein